MRSVTPRREGHGRGPRARITLAGSLALVTLLGATACTGDGDDDENGGGGAAGSGSSTGADAEPVVTVTTMKNLGKAISDVKREKVKAGVNAAVDPWFDGAFLGDFPRSDYAPAFASFTPGAASDAQQRDLDVLSNRAIAEEIETATAVKRRVRLEIFIHDGRARGATASFVLDFQTAGGLEQARRVSGRLFLAKDKGAWRIFGYDVDPAVTL